MSDPVRNWWERTGNFVEYRGLRQGDKDHCVFAAIAGALTHLASCDLWTPAGLCKEWKSSGQHQPNFGVANPALKPVADLVEKHRHNKKTAPNPLTPVLIREWIEDGGIVILSMEVRKGPDAGRCHMFTLVAIDEDRFQVWDTNGYKGFLTDEEITNGFPDPIGRVFGPHPDEDTLVLKRKKCGKQRRTRAASVRSSLSAEEESP